MLNRAPSVYTPIEPEDNSIVLPIVLSLLVHGAILTFIILFHRAPEIETPPPIETTIITPEELAALQSDIKANRAALADNSSDNAVDISSEALPESVAANVNNSRSSNNQSSHRSSISSSISSIFSSKSNKPIERSEQPNPFNQDMEDITQVDDLSDLDPNEDPTAKPNKEPTDSTNNKVDDTFPSNVHNTSTGDTSLKPSGGNNKSKGQIIAEVTAKILPNWTPPVNKVGTKVAASVTVNENGDVLGIEVHTNDEALKDSLEKAIKNSSPLTPIVGTTHRRLKLNFVVQ